MQPSYALLPANILGPLEECAMPKLKLTSIDICWVSLTGVCFLTFHKLVLCGLGVLLLSCWRWWCHPNKQWQSWNILIFLSSVLGNMLVFVWVQAVLWCICTSQMVRCRQSWGWILHLKEYGRILLKDQMWRIFWNIQLRENILFLRHRSDEFSCYFTECAVVKH